MSSAGSKPAELSLIEDGGVRFVEGPPGRPFLRSADDASLVVEACFNGKAKAALLHAPNLTERFFDLSSGEAGAVLQKLRNYRIRLAVVCADRVRFSRRFGEMEEEESRAGHFRVFESRNAACEWLSGLAVPD